MERTVAKKREQEVRASQMDTSRLITGLVVSANAALILFSMLLDKNIIVVLAISVMVFVWSLAQMILSGIFLIWSLLRRVVGHYVIQRAFRCDRYGFRNYLLSISGLTESDARTFAAAEKAPTGQDMHSVVSCCGDLSEVCCASD
jgi:thiosulfate reductase cytochrome b subunit